MTTSLTRQCPCIGYPSGCNKNETVPKCPYENIFDDLFTVTQRTYEDYETVRNSIINKCCSSCFFCNTAVIKANKKIPDNRKRDPALEWAVTLTMPPGHKTEQEMIRAIECIFNKASTNSPQPERADRWAYVLEYTEQGVPHVHGMYHCPSGRALSTKTIKYYWPLWDPKKPQGKGFQGGYHAPVRHGESYQDYIAKEGVVIKNVCS